MRNTLALALVLALAFPTAAASWSAWGSTEPDTSFDVNGGWMWSGPSQDPDVHDRPVYFDVVAEAPLVGQNPNLLGLGTVAHAPAESYTAVFGAWKDCNRDGYVGLAEGGVTEYRAEVLQRLPLYDQQTCPQGSPWNDGLWVTELLPIGPKSDTRAPGNPQYVIPRLIDDHTAQVWGDVGAPDGTPPGGSCQAAPLPRGTTASTGALIAFEDCFDGHQQAALLSPFGGAPDAHAPLSLWGDPTAPGGPQRGLLQRDPKRPDPTFTLLDCSKGTTPVRDPAGPQSIDQQDPTPGHVLTGSIGPEGIAQVTLFSGGPPGTFHKDITDANGNLEHLGAVAPSVNDPKGSLMDAASQLEYGAVERCDPASNPLSIYAPGQLVDFVPTPENDRHGVDPEVGRRENDYVFDLTQFTSSQQEQGTVMDGYTGAGFLGDMFGHDMPQDGGLRPARDVGASGPGWHSIDAAPTRQAALTRDDLDVTHPVYRTFYASMSFSVAAAHGLSFPQGTTTGTYGAEWCGGFTSGVHAGWDCDARHWWAPPGSSARPQNPYSHRALGATVGDAYELRDVDCEASVLSGGCH